MTLAIAGGTYWAHREWQLSELPGLCNAAANLEAWEELEIPAKRWVKLSPREAIAWFWLGQALRGQSRFDEAFEAYGHVPLRGPRGIEAATARLEIQFHVLHEPISALRIADEILTLEPKNPDALRHQIYFHAMTMQRPQMMAGIRRIIESGGDLPEHYLYLLNVEDLWFSDGPEVTEKWQLKSPDSPRLQASYLVQLAKRARAISRTTPGPNSDAEFQKIVSEFEHYASSLANLPQVLEFHLFMATDGGQVDEVAQQLALVPDDSVDDPVFWKYRGWYATQTSNLEDAERSYQEAIRLNPLGCQTRHEYAQLLRTLGRASEAAPQQALAARGTALVVEARQLKHLRDAPPRLLQGISQYAADCGDWQSANGIHRHQNPNTR